MLRLLSRVIMVVALDCALVSGSVLVFDFALAPASAREPAKKTAKMPASPKESKKYREVIFPKHSLGRLYDLKPGMDWLKVKAVDGTFLGTAAGVQVVPLSARLGLELDASVADEPKLLETLAPDALFALRSRNLEQSDSFLYSVYHLTGLRRLDLLDCSFTDKAVSGLVRLSQLERLTLGTCGLTGSCFGDLTQLKNLKYFGASCNKLDRQSISYVARMPALIHLDLARTQITDAELLTITKLSKLETLNINSNPALTARGFSALKSLRKLESLSAEYTAIKLDDLLALKGLPLRSMSLPPLKIRFSDMQKLRSLFPNCVISLQSHESSGDYNMIFAPVSR